MEAVVTQNSGFAESIPMPEKRGEFFKGLGVANIDVVRHMKKYVVRKPLHIRVYRALRSSLSKVKRKIIK